MEQIILNKDGFWYEDWDNDEKNYIREKLPVDLNNFAKSLNGPFRIEGDVTLQQFVSILQSMRPEVLDLISNLYHANLSEYLKEDLTPVSDDDKSNLKYIEVYKIYDLDNYSDVWSMHSYPSAHGIGDPWVDVYPEDSSSVNRSDSYAIEFTSWSKLMLLPIKLRETATFMITEWEKLEKPVQQGWFDKDGKLKDVAWRKDKEFKNVEYKEVTVIYTLNEFLSGLFNEICFFWKPITRDNEEKEISERYLESQDSDCDYFELKDVKSEEEQE